MAMDMSIIAELHQYNADAQDKRRGVGTSQYRINKDAKQLAKGCEMCEGRFADLLGDYVDGLNRLARSHQWFVNAVEEQERKLEVEVRRYFDRGDNAEETKKAMMEWLMALDRLRGKE